MTRLVLVGASGLAREALAVVRLLGHRGDVVVLDDDERTWGTTLGTDGSAEVLGGPDRVRGLGRCDLLLCAGRGTARRSLAGRLAAAGLGAERYARVVHPSVEVPVSCTVGPGSILLAHVTLTADVRVGAHVVAMPQVTLTHDDVLGDFATVCAGVSLGGHVVVGEAAYLGMASSVRERTTVGAGATLGMGAVLLRDLPAGETWAGVPATRLTTRQADAPLVRVAP